MKTILGTFAMLCVMMAQAHTFKINEDDLPVTKRSPYKKMVHFNPFALMIGGFELGFEKPTTTKESFLFNFGYYLSEEAGFLDLKDDFKNMSGVRIDIQYRFYKKTNNYIKNVYFAPFLNIKTMTAEMGEYNMLDKKTYYVSKSATTLSVGYLLGLRKSIFENVYLDLGIGGGVYIPASGSDHSDLHIGLFQPFKKGVQFRAHSSILIAL